MLLAVHAGCPLQGAVVGDVITNVLVGGRAHAVRSAEDLERAFSVHRAGSHVTFTLLRGDRRFSTTAAIGR